MTRSYHNTCFRTTLIPVEESSTWFVASTIARANSKQNWKRNNEKRDGQLISILGRAENTSCDHSKPSVLQHITHSQSPLNSQPYNKLVSIPCPTLFQTVVHQRNRLLLSTEKMVTFLEVGSYQVLDCRIPKFSNNS